MRYTTTVRVRVDDASADPIPGIQVALFDRDLFSPDDSLGTETTDANGEARFQYTTEDFTDLEERTAGDLPDLYAVIYDRSGKQVLSTRAETLDNSTAKFITVRVAGDLARSHGLLPEIA